MSETTPTALLHRPCIEYMDWTGEGHIWRCRECGETVDLAAEADEDEESEGGAA